MSLIKVVIAEKVQEIGPTSCVNISETTFEQVKDYHGFNFNNGPDGEYNGMKTYVLRAFDERLATHGSDFDLNAPLKSQQAAQEAAKSKEVGRRQTASSGAGITRMPTRVGSAMGPRPGGGSNLAAPNPGLARVNSFNSLSK